MDDPTIAAHEGRDPEAYSGSMNVPVFRASTYLFPDLKSYRKAQTIPSGDALTYATHGTPGAFALEKALAALEGGWRTRLCGSGLTACVAPLLGILSTGDHLLMVDSVYGPTRIFCDGVLTRMGVETTYYDPLLGSRIADLVRPNTKAIYMESPGSWTFEVQDVPAIAKIAREANALSILDNTWASPLYFKPFAHGVDISVQALTKYVGGHSDLLLGAVSTSEAAYPPLRKIWAMTGLCAAPDDVFLATRGLRTLGTRLPAHWERARRIIAFLREREEVAQILFPACEDDPGFALWKRDFLGASGLFGFILHERYSSETALAAMLDGMRLFGMGFSWGGFESLLVPVEPSQARQGGLAAQGRLRTATRWPRDGYAAGQLMRLHAGLEAAEDLIADLSDGLDRLRRAS